jgi:hypothetical protein
MPRTIDDSAFDPLIDEVRSHIDRLPWVAKSRVRLREEGRFLTGTVHVVPRGGGVTPAELEMADRDLRALHWRLRILLIIPRSRIE